MLGSILDRAADRKDNRAASAALNELINIMNRTGRAEQALRLFDRKRIYNERAGLGPWSQLHEDGKRLQIMNDARQYNEVLAEVETLRARMASLSDSAEQGESVNPWNVREVVLNAALIANIRSGRCEAALALVAEIVSRKTARGATALDLTLARFRAFDALLGLRRFEEARQALVTECQRLCWRREPGIPRKTFFRAKANLADLHRPRGSSCRSPTVRAPLRLHDGPSIGARYQPF